MKEVGFEGGSSDNLSWILADIIAQKLVRKNHSFLNSKRASVINIEQQNSN